MGKNVLVCVDMGAPSTILSSKVYQKIPLNSLGTRGLFLRFRFHFNVYTLNQFNVVEGLSGSKKQPVVTFLRCALPGYDRFSKGHSAAEGCIRKNIQKINTMVNNQLRHIILLLK